MNGSKKVSDVKLASSSSKNVAFSPRFSSLLPTLGSPFLPPSTFSSVSPSLPLSNGPFPRRIDRSEEEISPLEKKPKKGSFNFSTKRKTYFFSSGISFLCSPPRDASPSLGARRKSVRRESSSSKKKAFVCSIFSALSRVPRESPYFFCSLQLSKPLSVDAPIFQRTLFSPR